MFLSWIWTLQIYDGAGELVQWTIAIVVFIFGASVENPRPLYMGFGLGVILAFPFGWYDPNPDLVAEAAAAAFIACLVTRLWVPAAGLLWVLVATYVMHHCGKGALLGVSGALIMLAWHRSWRIGAVVTLVGAALIGLLTYRADLSDNTERWYIWLDTIQGFGWFGHGIGSFRYVFPDVASHINIVMGTRPDHAHNDFLEIIFELGYIGGFLALTGLMVILVRTRHYAETLIVICVLGTSITNFPLHIPSTLFMAAFALGRVCRLDALCSELDKSRVLLLPKLSRANPASAY